MAEVKTETPPPSGLKIAGTSFQILGTLLSANEASRGFRLNASEVIREGKLSALRVREQGERVQSAQRTGFSKAGVALSGTPLEVMAETARFAEENALEIERSAARQARELRRAASRRRTSGILAVGGAIIGGIYGGPAGATAGAQIGGSLGGGE